MRTPLRLFLLVLLALAPAGSPDAQVRPDLPWRTLRTPHFRVHFNPGLEPLARRTAANAEWAWARFAEELVPPRGIVDIVLADNVDYANGSATPYPSNRIIVYARPPVEAMALRNHVDWNLVLVTHELAHVFHIDRSRGWWRLAQRVFGRAAPLFPNTYAPSWMLEGLAVHYETQFTQGGRLAGTEFPAFARAAALGGHLPQLHELSLSAPRFPQGEVSYIFGAYAMSRAESGAVARYVERSSGRLIPWHFESSARAAFGEGFRPYWERWRDSVAASVSRPTATPSGADQRTLTTHGFEARFPRWLDDTTLIYVASDARVSTGLYLLHDSERDLRRERLGRRNSIDVNSPAGARRTVHAELEWADPYTLRSDLYLDGDGLLDRRRLTRNARLSSPDLHQRSGRVVAVQTAEGTTHLVVVDELGARPPRRLVTGNAERTWSEPRWSHDGTRVVASRWERGGTTSIVVLDERGAELRAFTPQGPRLAIASSPVFMPGDTAILFVSDHEGRAMIYRGDLRTGALDRVWGTATALNTPDVSPGGGRIAAVELAAAGYRVVTRDVPAAALPPAMPALDAGAQDSLARRRREFLASLLPPDTMTRASRYSALRYVRPTWWLPTIEEDDAGSTKWGLLTGSRDVVGRHNWEGSLAYETTHREWQGAGAYRWAGLGNPTVTLYGLQEWLHVGVQNQNGEALGILGQRERTGGVSVLFERPRVRLSTYAILGAELQRFDYRTYPAPLLGSLNERFGETLAHEMLEGTLGFSTMQRPGLAVSAQDGIAMSFTQRLRLGTGVRAEDINESVTTLSAAKSVPMPGYARHVLALRAAYGTAGHATTDAFGVGGVSGSSIELLPGVTYGSSRRTFFVRGFEPGTQLGVRAAAASLEYRAPLVIGGRGVPVLPVFFQKSSLVAFADAGAAWCSFPVADSFICPAPLRARTTLASVGAELALDAALQYDVPYRFRLGVAHPVKGEEFAARRTTFYFSLGSTF